MKMIGALVVLLAGSAAQAQDANPDASVLPGAKPESSLPAEPEGTAGSTGPAFWFQVGIEPRIDSDAPFTSDRDSTNVGWTLGMKYALTRGLTLEATAGPAATVDSDNDAKASSQFNLSTELRTTQPIEWGLTPKLRYQFTRNFSNFFENGVSSEHTIDFTVARTFTFRGGALDVALGPRRFESSALESDYWAFRFNPNVTFLPFGKDGAKLIVDITAGRSRYDDVTASIGGRRHDWTVEALAGVDIAPWVNTWLNPQLFGSSGRDIVNRFRIGVSLTHVASNVVGNDKTAVRFAPSFRIRVGF